MTDDQPATGSFQGAAVGAFESRRAEEFSRLIERNGGVPFVSPSLREVPIDNPREAIDFAHLLITGQIDVVLFLTGVGFRHLMEVVVKHIDRQRFLDALSDVVTIARGPKPVAAMREVGLTPNIKVPEPNTWREVLTTIDGQVPIGNQTIAVQYYGKVNPSLTAGLEARGAHVVGVPVYRWEMPVDTEPLKANLERLVAGKLDIVFFTSAHQIVNALELSRQMGIEEEAVEAFNRTIVASIGPTTTEALRDIGIRVDFEPTHPKMGHLVSEAAKAWKDLKPRTQPGITVGPPILSPSSQRDAAWYDSPFMKACRREPTPYTPVWLMRQAGRYMQEYRDVRGKVSFLELCANPQLCSEVMCTAVERLGVDAAIIFSDLLPILVPMGMDLEFAKGEGPVIHNPIKSGEQVDRLLELESMDELMFVVDTVKQTRADLPAHLPLIGFAGSPFTLASYAIEGGSSRSYTDTKRLMYSDPGAWQALMERFARAIVLYLNAQIAAGAQCVQLFDSWVGCLGPDDYRRYVLPAMRQIFAGLTPGVPVINFGTGNPELLPLLAEAGGHVIGIDWRIRLDRAWERVGHHRAVQGNMDPLVLLSEPEVIRARVAEVLDQAAGRPGHIFNLGHGVVQQTPVENAIACVEAVHELSARQS